MASSQGLADVNPQPRHKFNLFRAAKETLWRRLLFWGTVVGVSVKAVEKVLSMDNHVPDQAILYSVLVLAVCAGLVTSVYYFSVFILTRQSRCLLSAMAFSALSSGIALQDIVDVRFPGQTSYGWVMTAAWLISALYFASEAHSQSRLLITNKRRSIFQVIIASAALIAFPIAVLPYVLNPRIIAYLNIIGGQGSLLRITNTLICVSAFAFLLTALISNYRRYHTSGDRTSCLMCYFLTACGFALVFHSISSNRFDQWYVMSHASILYAWLMLLVATGIENAFAHKEANDRLEELETLHDISWSLVGAGTVRELLNMFVSTLVSKFGAKIATIYLADKNGDSLECAAECGSDDSCVGKKHSLVAQGRYPGFHSGHTAKAFETRTVQTARDVFVDVEFVPWRIIAVDDGCAASIPLVNKSQPIGVLNVYFSNYHQLTTRRLNLLTTIAAAATSAIEYALAKNTTHRIFLSENDLDLAA